MATIFIIFGLLLAIVGLIGCVLPIIPGPILSFISLIILSFIKDWEPFSAVFLIIMAGLMVLVSALDYVVPSIGAKKAGASKAGIWFSIIGMAIGIFFFPPWGIFFGAFSGGVIGEVWAGRNGRDAIKVGWGILWGNMIGIGFKLAYASLVIFFYVKEMF